MAQTGFTPILIYSSSTTTNAPAVGNLTNSTLGSELAINITDGKLFYKDNANAVQVIGWKITPTSAGGTGLTSYTAGDLLYYATGTTLSKLAIGASGRWLGSSGTAPQWNAPAALTKTDDTNVTLTLGGSASTALLNAASLTLGWTGQLGISRGGTNASSFTGKSGNIAGIVYFDGTSLVNNSTVTRLGFDTVANQLNANSILSSTLFTTAQAANGATNGGNVYIYQSGGLASTGGLEWQYATAGSGYGFKLAANSATDTLDIGYRANSATWTKFAAFGNNGRLTLGDSSTKAEIYLASSGSGSYITGVSSASSGNGYQIGHLTNVNTFQVQVGGSAGVQVASGGAAWTAISDERIKDVIEPITGAIDKVAQLRSVIGKYKTDAADKRRPFLIAQDVLKVLPEAVSETTLSKDDEQTYLAVAYTELIPLLVAAINEMSAEIKALKGN